MVGYYRRFIPHFATKAEPLTALMKKRQPDQVTWTSREAEAFELLKKEGPHRRSDAEEPGFQ